MREKVDDIHEQFLVGVGDFCDDCNFLAIGAPFEEELRWVLWVVSGNEGKVVLADGIWSWFAVCCHQLSKILLGDIVEFHSMVLGKKASAALYALVTLSSQVANIAQKILSPVST
jgi:hypothetical protein